MFQSIGDILQLFVLKDWETFRSAVLSNPTMFRNVAGAVSSCSQLNGMTLLHAAARYDAPLAIVSRMIELCPHMTSAQDCLGRTPLHVAAAGVGSGATSTNLLKLIAHADPTVCDIQDEEMKTPLHIACDNSCVLFEEDYDDEEYAGAGLPPPPPCHMSVKTLLACSLRPVTLQDSEGKTPLQHAVASNALSETIQLLQMAVMKSSSRKRPIGSVTTPAQNELMGRTSAIIESTRPVSTNYKRRITIDRNHHHVLDVSESSATGAFGDYIQIETLD
jgi:ankyrin repeat protein